MKFLIAGLFSVVLMFTGTASQAISRDKVQSASDFTGDNASFNLVTVSTTVATLFNYSTSRGAATVINVSTNTIYIGTSTAVTAGGTASFPLPAGQAVEFRNNAGMYGISSTGGNTVGTATEW
jgi:hypothetical protein